MDSGSSWHWNEPIWAVNYGVFLNYCESGSTYLLSGVLAEEAEVTFKKSLSLSQQQRPVAWELRAAIDLAKLWCEAGQRPAAVSLLEEVCRKVDGQSETADLRDARARLVAAA